VGEGRRYRSIRKCGDPVLIQRTPMIADCGNIYTGNLLKQLDTSDKEERAPKPPRRTPRGTQRIPTQWPLEIEQD
jgi:hypothetical protein